LTITVIGISGSLRRDSYNTRLLKAAQNLMPDHSRLELHNIADLWTGGRLMAPRAAASFDEPGQLSDDDLAKRLQTFMAGFVGYIRSTQN